MAGGESMYRETISVVRVPRLAGVNDPHATPIKPIRQEDHINGIFPPKGILQEDIFYIRIAIKVPLLVTLDEIISHESPKGDLTWLT
ncbi:hypothetical protein ABEB36_005884 [Hypothenemus hampei]|uniref:Uncharacterized protein n=1 Tax=Hypothenemus hampei TaxID=57062 RepID=A0ABD1EZR6_HYPHA